MIPQKVITKIDKQWSSSKAIVFDWKTASDEEAAYMMVLYVRDRDKRELDPDLVLKCIKVIRHGKFTDPKYTISSRWQEGGVSTVVDGKTYNVNMITSLEFEGERFKFKSFKDFELGFGILGKDVSMNIQNCLSLISYNTRVLQKLDFENLAERLRREANNYVVAQLSNNPPTPVVVDKSKITNKLISIIEKAFTEDNQKRLDMIEGIAFLMKTGFGDAQISDYLTALRRNPDTVKELTPEIFAEVRKHFA